MDNMDLSKGGYVVLPVAEYNELIAKLTRIDDAINVRAWVYGQHNNLEVFINNAWLLDVAMTKAAAKYDLDQYVMRTPDDFYVSTITLASRKPAPTIEE